MTTLGDMLIAARKDAGLTAHEIAQRTHIMQAAIHALDSDDHSSLPTAGYVRGYILSYCKACSVDPRPYLEQFENQSGSSRRDSIGRASYESGVSPLPKKSAEYEMNWMVILVAVLVITLIAGGIFFLTRGDGGASSPHAQSADAVLVVSIEADKQVPEENRVPFTFTIGVRESRASDVSVTIDGNVALDGALTGLEGGQQTFMGVLIAEIEIAHPENVIITQGGRNILIPDDGNLTLTATHE